MLKKKATGGEHPRGLIAEGKSFRAKSHYYCSLIKETHPRAHPFSHYSSNEVNHELLILGKGLLEAASRGDIQIIINDERK
mmetsp:Transcript_22412/g.33879  ORF Transcript_22412/g.33879 Transcript_22412/m.33879 type:complete len:81 (+) Transcript_22412:989-1231(+)